MKNTMEIYHLRIIPFIWTSFEAVLSFKNDVEMMEWGEMKGDFLTKANPLILKSPSFQHHSVIPSKYPILDSFISTISRSFWHSSLIPFLSTSEAVLNDIEMTEWLKNE